LLRRAMWGPILATAPHLSQAVQNLKKCLTGKNNDFIIDYNQLKLIEKIAFATYSCLELSKFKVLKMLDLEKKSAIDSDKLQV